MRASTFSNKARRIQRYLGVTVLALSPLPEEFFFCRGGLVKLVLLVRMLAVGMRLMLSPLEDDLLSDTRNRMRISHLLRDVHKFHII